MFKNWFNFEIIYFFGGLLVFIFNVFFIFLKIKYNIYFIDSFYLICYSIIGFTFFILPIISSFERKKENKQKIKKAN